MSYGGRGGTNVKTQHGEVGGSATPGTVRPWGKHRVCGAAHAGAHFPLLCCQHLFARPGGADPPFMGRQLAPFEMIGFNLLSFEVAYLRGPSKACSESGCVV